MSQDADRYNRLVEVYRDVQSRPQSAENERALARLEFELTALECKLRYEAVKRAELLFNVWVKTGAMRVMLPDGNSCEASPGYNLRAVESVWAGKREACYLAALSFGVPHLKVLGDF